MISRTLGAAAVGMLLSFPALAETNVVSATPVAKITWAESGFGPQLANVVGDMTNGPHLGYIKFTSGFVSPVHSHSGDYTGIVISGTTRHYEPGKRDQAVDLPPGSTWSIPGGLPHVSECLAGSDCIMAIYQTESFDIRPE